jgi:DNA-directed RNA polymerase specialized sigma24 family protein
MSVKRPDYIPSVVPIDQIPEVEELADPDIAVEPEAYACLTDHSGLIAALDLLPERQREILCEKIGINESGASHSSAEIAQKFDISIEAVSSALTRARNRLRACGNILEIIHGEITPPAETHDNSLQTS